MTNLGTRQLWWMAIWNTVSVLLEPRGSIFHSGFLGGVLFKFEQPAGVFEVGLYKFRAYVMRLFAEVFLFLNVMAERKRRLEDIENSPKRCLHNYMCSLSTQSFWQVKVYWVGVYSRWGSIISISAIDWGCIRNLNMWGCNQ